MSKSNGKYAQFISDRSGMAFPYKEMVVEWNGSRVHVSEFEPKQPQLEPKPAVADPQGLQHARPARVEPATENLLPGNPLSLTSGSSTVIVTEPSHRRFDTNSYSFNCGSNATVTENSGGMFVTAGPVTLTP
jgi:hypothetical protein